MQKLPNYFLIAVVVFDTLDDLIILMPLAGQQHHVLRCGLCNGLCKLLVLKSLSYCLR